MKQALRWIFGPLGAVVLSGCSLFGGRSGYEQPAYEVVGRVEGSIEVRRYGPRLAAETTVEGADADTSRSAAFRILAAYIFGANRPKTEVAMTAPVEVDARPRKIAMTAPVETAEAGEGRTVMRFFLPRSLALATAPEPNDPRVRLVTVPEETLAVLRFTGWRDSGAVAERSEQLLRALEGSAWRPLATPVALFYDPPWTLPFLRRNEVAVPAARR
jgi:hypothetical protein